MKNWYGCIGFVSLLGIWGALAGEPLFYPFFAFLVFFGSRRTRCFWTP